jgi:hypothetical protein
MRVGVPPPDVDRVLAGHLAAVFQALGWPVHAPHRQALHALARTGSCRRGRDRWEKV